MQGMSFVNDSMSDHKSCGACPVQPMLIPCQDV